MCMRGEAESARVVVVVVEWKLRDGQVGVGSWSARARMGALIICLSWGSFNIVEVVYLGDSDSARKAGSEAGFGSRRRCAGPAILAEYLRSELLCFALLAAYMLERDQLIAHHKASRGSHLLG